MFRVAQNFSKTEILNKTAKSFSQILTCAKFITILQTQPQRTPDEPTMDRQWTLTDPWQLHVAAMNKLKITTTEKQT